MFTLMVVYASIKHKSEELLWAFVIPTLLADFLIVLIALNLLLGNS